MFGSRSHSPPTSSDCSKSDIHCLTVGHHKCTGLYLQHIWEKNLAFIILESLIQTKQITSSCWNQILNNLFFFFLQIISQSFCSCFSLKKIETFRAFLGPASLLLIHYSIIAPLPLLPLTLSISPPSCPVLEFPSPPLPLLVLLLAGTKSNVMSLTGLSFLLLSDVISSDAQAPGYSAPRNVHPSSSCSERAQARYRQWWESPEQCMMVWPCPCKVIKSLMLLGFFWRVWK